MTNREFTKTLGRVLRRPAFFWLPRFALCVMFGGIADDALLASMKAVPKKLLDTGFVFDHTELGPASVPFGARIALTSQARRVGQGLMCECLLSSWPLCGRPGSETPATEKEARQ